MLWHIILSNKKFEDVKDDIPKDLYERLINRRKRVSKKEINIKHNLLRKLCQIDNDAHMESLLKGLEPYLRNKKRSILIIGGNC